MTEQYLEERIDKLEENLKIVADNLNGLIKMVNTLRTNTDADITGTRQSVSQITPYTETKKAYYGEADKTFYNVPEGKVQVFFSNYNDAYQIYREGSNLRISFFMSLLDETDVTISITQ